MEFTKRLASLLKEKSIKKSVFLSDLGYSKNAFREWETGVTKSYMNKLAEIADYLDVSADYLLGRTDERDLITKHAASAGDGTLYDGLPEEAIQEMESYREFLKEKYRKK